MKLMNKSLNSNLVLAPMTKFSDHAFRISCIKHGAGLVFTPKYNINGLINNFKKFEPDFQFNSHPIVLQLIGNDVRIFKKVLDKLSSFSHDFIDLNLCCPSPEAIRDEIGGFLLKRPERIKDIIKSLIKYSDVPVSAKLRSGWDPTSINAPKIAKMLEKEGIGFITIHGRSVVENYEIKNNINIVKLVKEAVGDTPIIGSGDIVDGKTALVMRNKTRCDLLMIGRAAIGNPFIFKSIQDFMKYKKRTTTTENQYRYWIFEYLELLKKYEPILYNNFSKLREHLIRMIRFNLLKTIKNEDLRDIQNVEELKKKL